MYNYEGEFLLLDDRNDMLPKKNIFITILCCFIFYNIIIYDICIIDKNIFLKILQFILWLTNFISLLILFQRDPGRATNLRNSSKNAIRFINENVIYNYKMLAKKNLKIYNDEDFCEKCCVILKNSISHCRHCDICFENRDHHCAWFNRCIASKNLKIFRNFLISSTFSAFLLIFDVILLINSGTFYQSKYFKILFIYFILIASSGLFVLTGLLTVQYGISALLNVKTRKLLSGSWKWKSTRLFQFFRKQKVIIEEFEDNEEKKFDEIEDTNNDI